MKQHREPIWMRQGLKLGVAGLVLLGATLVAIAEEITLTTSYPSPRGVYQQLRATQDTWLAYDTTPPGPYRVGIGTTSPSAKLDLESDQSLADGLDLNNTALDGDPRIKFQLSGSSIFTLGVDDADGDKLKLGVTELENNTRLTVDSTGNIGIGTTSPAAKLDVAGNVKIADGTQGSGKVLTSNANGVASWQSGSIPAGAVMFFNLAACPSGWADFTLARGRYVVGVLSGGTVSGTAGTAFTVDRENRPVGQHTHTVTDPGHTHNILAQYGSGPSPTRGIQTSDGTDRNPTPAGWESGYISGSTGVTINNAGSVAGTNAPYVQLLACQKT